MRERFDRELQSLNSKLTVMGALCENAISMAVKAFLENDQTYAEKAIEVDLEIDAQEKEIESQCLSLLLRQQPVASDLRMISSALKMITDIERIGDQASDIAELTKYVRCCTEAASPNIEKMAAEAVGMVKRAIDSFVRHDLDAAKAVIEYDDVVDDLFHEVKNDIIGAIRRDSTSGETIIDILMIAKYLERIADHAVNIAEWVVFSITGEHSNI